MNLVFIIYGRLLLCYYGVFLVMSNMKQLCAFLVLVLKFCSMIIMAKKRKKKSTKNKVY